MPEELAVELLGLADRYLLNGLKQLCGFTLEKMIAVDTVARIIQAAERWDSPEGQLKGRCMEYILTNYEAVVAHPVFEELASSPQLLLEITRAVRLPGLEAFAAVLPLLVDGCCEPRTCAGCAYSGPHCRNAESSGAFQQTPSQGVMPSVIRPEGCNSHEA